MYNLLLTILYTSGKINTNMVKRITYIKKVYENLKSRILNGDLLPRQRIYENGLAKEFKISRGPIRESLARLKQEGFIYDIPGKGNYVSPVTKKEIVEIFEIREKLELLAVKKSLKDFSLDEFRNLKKEFMKFEKLPLNKKNRLEYLSLDRKFHYLLFKNCNNKKLKDLLIHFQEHMNRFQKYALNINSFSISIKEHLDITESIEKGDINLIEDLLLAHLKRVKESYFYQFME